MRNSAFSIAVSTTLMAAACGSPDSSLPEPNEEVGDFDQAAATVQMGLVTGGIYQNTPQFSVIQPLSTHKTQFFCEMQQLGTKWLRVEVDWYGTSAATYKAIFDAAHAKGIKVIALVPGPTCASNSDSAAIDAYTTSYVAKLNQLATVTFAGSLPDAWEILNEPNMDGCSSGARAGGNVFAWLLRRVWEWKQKNARKELIISGGPLNTYVDEPWWDDFFDSGAWDVGPRPFDLMGVHPYNPFTFNKDQKNFDHWATQTKDWLVQIKQKADQRGKASDTKLIVTEFGWQKCNGPGCVASEEDMAIGMRKATGAFAQSGVVHAALWYDYRDDPGTHMGLRRQYDAALQRHPVKAGLWQTSAMLAGGPAGAAESCWGGGSAGGLVGLRLDNTYDATITKCHQDAGGTGAAGKPFDNGGGAFVHGWGPGQVQDFSGGPLGANICMHRSGKAQAFMVRGDIRKTYFAAGGGPGWLGYPIENEHDAEQKFEHGWIRWSHAKSAFEAVPY